MNTISSLLKNLRNRQPVGTIEMFAGASAPTDWLLCNGQAVSRTTYSSLFALIGATYGAGDGSTTFNVPDLRDKVAVGVSGTKALGSTGGSETKSYTPSGSINVTLNGTTLAESQIPKISGSINARGWAVDGGTIFDSPSGKFSESMLSSTGALTASQAASGRVQKLTFSFGGGGSHTHSINTKTFTGTQASLNVVQPYTAINYIIYAGK